MKMVQHDWIGEIPDDWELVKIGSIFRCRNEKVNDTDYPPLSVTRSGIVPQMENVAKTDANDNRKMVKIYDFVINSRSDRKQSCGVSQLDGSVSLINTVLFTENDKVITPEYTNLVMKNYGFAEEFYRWGHGIVADLWTTRWQEMKSIVLPLPNTQQQKVITDFVYKKVTEIDNIIVHEQATIEELKSYKQSVITEAVTKGIDQSIPMKDSGVDWIGEISQTARVAKAGLLYEIVLGKMVSANKTDNSETLEDYYCAANVHFDCIDYSGFKKMWFTNAEKKLFLVQQGDLLVVEGGAGAGGAHIIEKEIQNCYIQNSIMVARSIKGIPNKWLYYTLFSLVKRNYIEYVCNKATIPHFTKEKLGSTPIVVFEQDEIVKIIHYLDAVCFKIDSIISIKQQKIEELKEYKKSLIYEYVTGKKEVV